MMENKTKELILQYFDAFSNIYTIISMKRAFRIIKKQNPEISLTEDGFRDFVDSFDYNDKYYIIVYDEEMYSDEPCKKTDALQKFLIAEFLYTFLDDSYDKMKKTQDGFRFYVPERDELLKYGDQFYHKRNIQHSNMKNFLQTEIHIDSTLAEEIIYDWILMMECHTENEIDIVDALEELKLRTKGEFKNFKSLNQIKKFTVLYADMFNHTRLPMFRGLTPIEANREVSPEVYEKYL